MSPQIARIRIPDSMLLARHEWALRTDERPLLRDASGRVLAVVEVWTP